VTSVCEGGDIARRKLSHNPEKNAAGPEKDARIVPSQCVSVVGLLLAMTNAVLGLQSLEKRRLKRVLLYVLIEFSSLSNKYFVTRITFYRRIEIDSPVILLCPLVSQDMFELAPVQIPLINLVI
jgi:hypothetical protein